MLNTNFVAADDHMVVLTVADALSALRQHRKVLIAYRRMDGIEDHVVPNAGVVVRGGHTSQPTVPDRTSGG